MAKKHIYRSQHIDHATGVVTETLSINKETTTAGKFLLAYVEDIGKLIGCTKGEIAIVLASLKYVDYATNEIVLTPGRRSSISTITGMSKGNMYNILSRLYLKHIFIREGERIFLNPRL